MIVFPTATPAAGTVIVVLVPGVVVAVVPMVLMKEMSPQAGFTCGQGLREFPAVPGKSGLKTRIKSAKWIGVLRRNPEAGLKKLLAQSNGVSVFTIEQALSSKVHPCPSEQNNFQSDVPNNTSAVRRVNQSARWFNTVKSFPSNIFF